MRQTGSVFGAPPPPSEASVREAFQDGLDRVRKGQGQSAHRIMERMLPGIVPYMSWWTFKTYEWSLYYLADRDGADIAEVWLSRGLDLSRLLSPTGELCAVCIETGEKWPGSILSAEPATVALNAQDGQEPIPVCKNHVREAEDIWFVVGATWGEVQPLWPPWKRPPTWGQRRARLHSSERYAYACMQQAMLQNPDGMYRLASCYEMGMGVSHSPDQAIMWYQHALDAGFPGAREGIKRVQRDGPWEKPQAGGDSLEDLLW